MSLDAMVIQIMSSPVTLYVDGACRGNPGPGGWGALIEYPDGTTQELWGGAAETTNNRMELTAAIQGVQAVEASRALIIWTDSSYVQKGMSEWLAGWKKRNWRKSDGSAVLNADLWQKLDELCQARQIDWRWIKGHAGHAGNEKADQLANRGVDELGEQMPAQKKNDVVNESSAAPATVLTGNDWLANDPLGLGFPESADLADDDWIDPIAIHNEAEQARKLEQLEQDPASHGIKRTPATLSITGKRQLILDTETTGFSFKDGDRIIEVGVIEMINRKLTGSSFHVYINPEREVGDSVNVHGITDEFLQDKALFANIAAELDSYLNNAEIIAHNATFDMNFLEGEFLKAGLPSLKARVEVTDTLAIAKRKHPGQKNSLDALVKRYDIKERDRTFHGALLDAEILADVYLAMTGGQVTLDIGTDANSAEGTLTHQTIAHHGELIVVHASAEENQLHEQWIEQYEKKNGTAPLWRQAFNA